MRFTEFKASLVEETLTLSVFNRRNGHYYWNLINLIQTGKPVAVEIGNKIEQVIFKPETAVALKNIWDPKRDKEETATDEQIAQMKELKLETESGQFLKLSKIVKSPDIVTTGGNRGIWNKGNIAEGIMASAVSAKFRLEGGEVTFNELVETIKNIEVEFFDQLDKDGNVKTDANGNVKQNAKGLLISESFGKELKLIISLNKRDFDFFLQSAKDMEGFRKYSNSSEIYRMYEDCANYVNESDNVLSAIEKIENANPDDKVNVTADGASFEAQSSTKADLWIAIGEKKERLLSIKTSTVKHIGAVSGHLFENLSEFFRSTVGFELPEDFRDKFSKNPASKMMMDPENPEKEIKNPEYVKMSTTERSKLLNDIRKSNYHTGFIESYKWVIGKLNEKLGGDSDDREYDFVKTVGDGVIQHATMKEDIRLVIISPNAKKAYTELEINDKLHESLAEYDLVPQLDLGENYKLLIYGYPKTDLSRSIKNDKTLFLQLRSYIQDAAVRNVVEIGGLLKQLTEVIKEKEETGEEDVIKVKDQPQEVPINIINAVIKRNQLPIQQKPQIIAQANELLKAGYNFNQIEEELVKLFAQQPEETAPQDTVEPAITQQPEEPVPAQDTVEPTNQQKQRLGHLRQGPEQQPVSEELISILKNAGIR
jgi:hypothetical protein